VFSVLSDTRSRSRHQLTAVTDVLVKTASFCNQSFFQMVDVTDPATVDSLLQNAPDGVVNRIEVRAVRRRVLWTDKVGCLSWKQCNWALQQVQRLCQSVQCDVGHCLPCGLQTDPVVSIWCSRRYTELQLKLYLLLKTFCLSTKWRHAWRKWRVSYVKSKSYQ